LPSPVVARPKGKAGHSISIARASLSSGSGHALRVTYTAAGLARGRYHMAPIVARLLNFVAHTPQTRQPMHTRKNLPTGVQTFATIRNPEHNFAYVDKTAHAHSLLALPGYYFLSRPRRFGKSLFLDTLAEVLQGSRELFEGLYIYNRWDWSVAYPVIRIDLTSGEFSAEAPLRSVLHRNIRINAQRLGVSVSEHNPESIDMLFSELIYNTAEKYQQKVAILIDEYDKPILDNIEKPEMAATARELLRVFYSAIKSHDAYLRFVFITGVSKFSKLNLFSGLNNLTDITLNRRYATIVGYTHHDLQTTFADYTPDVDLEEMQRWYNGYNWLGEPVYNPYDVLLFFENGYQYRNYWWQTGNPSFLIERLKAKPQYLPNLENLMVSESMLNAFEIDRIGLPSLLWQTGYLTFAREELVLGVANYYLKVPNREVQLSLNELFFEFLTQVDDAHAPKVALANLLLDADMGGVERQLKALFAAIPDTNYTRNNIARFEGYYASVM
jgi:hypothetical protein